MFRPLIEELNAEAAAVLDLDLTGVEQHGDEGLAVLLEKKICYFTKYIEDLGFKLVLLIDDCPIKQTFIAELVGHASP